MKCLNDVQLQALVDNEASDEARIHAASCARCRERLRERTSLTAAILNAINVPAAFPEGVARRVAHTLEEGSGHGATRLRPGMTLPDRAWRTPIWSAAAVAVATLVAVLFVAPLLKAPTTVSASEVLARSANRLAQQVTTGVEMLEYELVLDGVPREMMPDHIDGAYRVTQAIDHDTPGRYVVAAYDPQDTMVWGVAQDPAGKRRVINMRLDDQPYRFEFDVSPSVTLSPPEMERLHMEASVTMMQASGNQRLELVETAAGSQYRVEVPHVSAATPSAVWDLSEARALIDAGDYHIVELSVRGTFLKRPYSVSYRLLNRTVLGQGELRGTEFDMPVEPNAIRMRGEGSAVPVRDALVAALREVTRAKQVR